MFGIIVLAVYAALMIGVTLIFTRRRPAQRAFMWQTGESVLPSQL